MKKPLRTGGLTEAEEAEIVLKAEKISRLTESDGWNEFKEILAKSLDDGLSISSLDLGLSDSAVGREVRVRREVDRRVRQMVRNMISLVEDGKQLVQLRSHRKDSQSIFRKTE